VAKALEDAGQAGWQEDRAVASGEERLSVLERELVGSQVADALGGEAEQQSERACGPHVNRQRVVVEAPPQ
jgi:hypothetical protein